MGKFNAPRIVQLIAATIALTVGLNHADAATIYLSTNADARIGGLTTIEKGDIVAYTSADPSVVAFNGTTWSDSASIFFKGKDHFRKSDGTTGAQENVFAFHIFSGGEILLGSSSAGRLGAGDPTKHIRDGGSKFDTRDLVKYDPADMNTVSLFLDGADVFRKANGDPGATATIDAASLLPNGNILLSTRGGEKIGTNLLDIRKGDVIEYNPVTDVATLVFSQDNFRKADGTTGADGDVDAVSYFSANELILSANAAERLGNPFLLFADQDGVLYNIANDTASLFFNGDNFRNANGDPGAQEELKGLHFIVMVQDTAAAVVPEPSTLILATVGLGALATLRRRRR